MTVRPTQLAGARVLTILSTMEASIDVAPGEKTAPAPIQTSNEKSSVINGQLAENEAFGNHVRSCAGRMTNYKAGHRGHGWLPFVH